MNLFQSVGFGPADILVPQNVDLGKWCVVACDQYTSEPEYWEKADAIVGDSPSALRLILPEVFLEQPDSDDRIRSIHSAMEQIVERGILREYADAMILTRRVMPSGSVRTGLVGAVDLEAYDYRKGSSSLIRATEGTILERLPPRIRVRKDALLELPHIMLFIDDPGRTVIEPIAGKAEQLRPLYRTDLMLGGGSVEGYLVDPGDYPLLASSLSALADPDVFAKRYGRQKGVLLYAVGDGNHSLATAKACYEDLKKEIGDEALNSPARYALAELVNLHDPSLVFEAIHRVVFDVDPGDLLSSLREELGAVEGASGGQSFAFLCQGGKTILSLTKPLANLTVGSLQRFLDHYVSERGGRIDYIHGADVVERLCREKRTAGFLLPDPQKADLFPAVVLDGALPRKTFSVGHAWEKRYYLETRKIR